MKELASIAALRGAKMAKEIGQRARGTELLEKRARLFEKPVPPALLLLPSLMTCKRFASLAGKLDDEESGP